MFVLNQRHVLGICDLHHRARLRPEHLGLRARRHGQGRHARQAEARRLQLARARHRGGRRARADRRRQALRRRARSTTRSRKIKAAGINIIGNYIFGLPEDTAETMQETLDLALDLNCEFANFYSAMAYPGSPLYEQALRARLAAARRRGAATRSTPSTRCRCRRDISRPARCCASAIARSTPTSRTSRISTMVRREVRRRHRRAHPRDDGAPARAAVTPPPERDAARRPHLRRRRPRR